MIRNIVYLDVDKMYSMSSQVFEGVTEYIVSQKQRGVENTETQKGPMASGRILGDILRQQETQSEGKVLNDYSFSLFEKKLFDTDRVRNLTEDSGEQDIAKLRVNSFVKITANVIFNDMRWRSQEPTATPD